MKRIEAELTRLFLLWAENRHHPQGRWKGQFATKLKQMLRKWGNWKNAPRGDGGKASRFQGDCAITLDPE